MTSTAFSTVGCESAGIGVELFAVPLTPDEIGKRIAHAREDLGWTQVDLAVAAHVTPGTIHRWEKGKLPSVSELFRLADVLGKPADYLTEPPERQVEMADLRSGLDALNLRLQLLEETHEQSREAVLELLASIHALLVPKPGSQGQQDAQST